MIVAGMALAVGSLQEPAPPVTRADDLQSSREAIPTISDIDPGCSAEYEVPNELPSKPSPNCSPGKWITTADYPLAAAQAGEEGSTSFTLSVDAGGRPTGCVITSSSGSSRLDARVCPLLIRRARFVPAFAENGQSVEGEYSSAIRWEIPRRGLAEVAPAGHLIGTYVIEKDGTGSECEIEAAEGWAAEYAFCDLPRFEPVLDEEGQPMRVKVRVMQQVVHEPMPE